MAASECFTLFQCLPVFCSKHHRISENNRKKLTIEVNNKNTRKRYKTCLKLTIKTPERRH